MSIMANFVYLLIEIIDELIKKIQFRKICNYNVFFDNKYRKYQIDKV